MGPRASLDSFGEENISWLLPQEFEPQTVKPVQSHYTDYAITVELHKYYTFHITSKRIHPEHQESIAMAHIYNDKKKI